MQGNTWPNKHDLLYIKRSSAAENFLVLQQQKANKNINNNSQLRNRYFDLARNFKS